jgi:outer membrane lipoprotein-sorting protein
MNKLIVLFFLLLNIHVFGDNNNFKPMKDTLSFQQKLREKAKQTNSIECSFVQEKNLSMLSEKIVSKGHFYFKKSNLLRWEYLTPSPYLIIINKGSICIKDGKKTKKYDTNSNKIFKGLNDMMLNSVQGNVLDYREFNLIYSENETYFLVEMYPKKKELKSYLKCIYMYFDKKDCTVSKIKTIELSDDYTCIEFLNKKYNAVIPDNTFETH